LSYVPNREQAGLTPQKAQEVGIKTRTHLAQSLLQEHTPPSHFSAVASRQRSASAFADRLRRTISRTAPATAASARIFFTKVASRMARKVQDLGRRRSPDPCGGLGVAPQKIRRPTRRARSASIVGPRPWA